MENYLILLDNKNILIKPYTIENEQTILSIYPIKVRNSICIKKLDLLSLFKDYIQINNDFLIKGIFSQKIEYITIKKKGSMIFEFMRKIKQQSEGKVKSLL